MDIRDSVSTPATPTISFDFTDIDRTLAIGFLSSGKAWGRSD